MSIYENYERLLDRYGVTEGQVRRSAGIKAGVIRRWKKGIEPRVIELQWIANYFGVSLESLLYGDDLEDTPALCVRFAKRLRKARREADYSVEYLADVARVHVYAIYRMEHGELFPGLRVYHRILRALEVTEEEFWKGRKESNGIEEIEKIARAKGDFSKRTC